MSLFNRSKVNQLLSQWPSRAVFVCSWLHDKGYGYDLIAKYRSNGWLEPVGHGAVARVGDKVDWPGGVYAMQAQLGLPIHVGGKSALLLKGLGHFIPKGKGWELTLFAPPKTNLPAWFKSHVWEARPHLITTQLFAKSLESSFSSVSFDTFSIKVSSPERAIFEVLYRVPNEESFEEAKLLMEGLTTLRSKLVQQLLEDCRSVKVKRLFLYLAEECNHAWLKKIEISKVNLGKGKRLIEKKGMFNAKFGITVPKVLK